MAAIEEARTAYEVLDEISRGAYGVVYRALDTIHDEVVALKQEIHGLSESTKTEIHILQSLPRHPAIIGFKKAIMEEGSDNVFVVMEYFDNDLKRYMKARRKMMSPLTPFEIKTLMKQLLNGVSFLHDNGVMHRDLKPANILINNNNDNDKAAELKICDFGLAAPTTRGLKNSPRVGTRWYRAPELLLESTNYSSAVDVWAVGCIMAELVSNKKLFQGKSDHHELPCIHKIVSRSCNLIRRKMAIAAAVSGTTPLTCTGIDLLERLLAYDPAERITAREALDHAWFMEL